MTITSRANPRRCHQWHAIGTAILSALAMAGPTLAQSASSPATPIIGQVIFTEEKLAPAPAVATKAVDVKPAVHTEASPKPDGTIQQVGCSTCGGGGSVGPLGGGCGAGGCGGNCNNGAAACDCCCNAETWPGKFICGVYQCICCPDPCYEPPHWLAVADSAFFVDAARPITQTRLRWDSGFDMQRPDRAEYFFARENTSPNQLVPTAPSRPNAPGRGPNYIARTVDYEDLSLYTEAAAARFGAFIEVPYREVDPNVETFSPSGPPTSGFTDINVGAKSLLLDCELLQFSFQFKTFIPTGSAGKGFGTSHVSLEPSFLLNLKLGACTYLQAQTAYWIPIGGDQIYQGNIFHAHESINHILWKPCNGLQLIGTFEVNEWSILGGNYTADFLLPSGGNNNPVALSATSTIVSAGPGIRCVVCDKIDLGVGTAFSLTGNRWTEDLIRAEFRMRF